MNFYQVAEAVETLRKSNPLFGGWLDSMEARDFEDTVRYWANRYEPYDYEELNKLIGEQNAAGWGELEPSTVLEALWRRLRALNAEDDNQGTQGLEASTTQPGLWEGARTTFQEIENGRESAREQCQMLETIYMEVYAEYGIEIKKGGPSGMHAAKLAGKDEEVKKEVRRRWRAWVKENMGVTL